MILQQPYLWSSAVSIEVVVNAISGWKLYSYIYKIVHKDLEPPLCTGEIPFFAVQLATSGIGNHIRLMLSLVLRVMTTHTHTFLHFVGTLVIGYLFSVFLFPRSVQVCPTHAPHPFYTSLTLLFHETYVL